MSKHMAIAALGIALATYTYARERSASPWGPKEFGVLLLGPSAGADWNQMLIGLSKSLGPRVPVESVVGVSSSRDLQRAISRLEQAQVRKIVTIPLFLYSQSPEIEQIQYLLGLREFPSAAFMTRPHSTLRQQKLPRAQAKVPLVMAGALEDHPFVAEVLLTRAREMSKYPARESVLLIGLGTTRKDEDYLRLRWVNSLAKKIQQAERFQIAQSALLLLEGDPQAREKSLKELRDLIRHLSLEGRVLVIPYILTEDGHERIIAKKLDGLFFQWKGKALLPHPKILEWIQEKIAQSRDLPNMVKYKDARTLPPLEPKRIVQ